MKARARAAILLLGLLLIFVAGCQSEQERLVRRIDASLASAGRYLVGEQSPDGAWRGRTYGCFRDGPTLTPYVMSALYFLPQAGPQAETSYRKGVDYLVAMVSRDGRIRTGPRGLNFPVYTSASASRVVKLLDKSPRNLRAQRAWLAYLLRRQLNESLGWSPSDRQYGGWGFSVAIPRKPRTGQTPERFFESNLAATIFGIAALRSARVLRGDPSYEQILVFVRRCQNFSENPSRRDEKFDDGGFYFIPDDPLQNKAGVAGVDALGRQRFHSYGTMTADGFRALLRCGLPADHPRVVAARGWLERNFSVRHNPGTFTADREVLRDATYYYWVWAVAHAFGGLNIREIQTPAGKVRWAEVLSEELLSRQRPDGSWVNRYTDAKEDDPLVSTPWAAAALAICRHVITQQPRAIGRGCKIPPHPPASERSDESRQ